MTALLPAAEPAVEVVDAEPEPVAEGEALAHRETVTTYVARFHGAVEKVRRAFAMIDEASDEAGVSVPSVGSHGNWSPHTEKVVQRMERSAWHSLAARLELNRFMSIKKWREFQLQLSDGELPPITVDAILAFGDGMRAQIPEMHAEAVLEVYNLLRPRETSPVYDLKMNNVVEIGERVALPGMVRVKDFASGFQVNWGWRGESSAQLSALERVLDALDGRGLVAKGHTSELEHAIEMSPRGSTRLFNYKCFKNRNLHLQFRRPDLLAKFNALAGGKNLKPDSSWTKGKGRAKRPPVDTRPVAERDALDFFETPLELANSMVDMADIHYSDRVLEPSAGDGAIALALKRAESASHLTCIEIHPERAATLRKHCFKVIEADFMSFEPQPVDTVIMNPPFSKRQDTMHVARALEWLKPGGVLVAVMSASAMTRDDAMTVELRADVEARGGRFEMLPEGTFKESGTMVRACLVVVPRRAK